MQARLLSVLLALIMLLQVSVAKHFHVEYPEESSHDETPRHQRYSHKKECAFLGARYICNH